MKKLLFLGSLVLATAGIKAQIRDTLLYRNQIKGNILVAPLGMLNIGYEHAFNNHWTGQADIFISPWKSVDNGRHLQAAIGFIEGRYYFTKSMEKWYVGGNFGISIFNLTKWNYWKENKYYQKGVNFMLGATVGYQLKLSEKWNLDIYAGAGNSQDLYHGWKNGVYPKERADSAVRWNKSGEWIPYRGGLMLSYKF